MKTIYSKQTTSTNNTGLWSFPFVQEGFLFHQMIWIMDWLSCWFCGDFLHILNTCHWQCRSGMSVHYLWCHHFWWTRLNDIYLFHPKECHHFLLFLHSCLLSDKHYNISHLGKSQSRIDLAPIVVITDVVNKNPISVQNLTLSRPGFSNTLRTWVVLPSTAKSAAVRLKECSNFGHRQQPRLNWPVLDTKMTSVPWLRHKVSVVD